MKEYTRYELLKALPGLKVGAIFYHDKEDSIRGSVGCGCLKLAWEDDGSCQQEFCGDTFVFPGQLVAVRSWFKRIPGMYTRNQRHETTQEMSINGVTIRTTAETWGNDEA